MKVACQGPYDMEELEKEQVAKRQLLNVESKRKSRALRTPDKVKEDRELDKVAHQESRALRTPQEVKEDRDLKGSK